MSAPGGSRWHRVADRVAPQEPGPGKREGFTRRQNADGRGRAIGDWKRRFLAKTQSAQRMALPGLWGDFSLHG
jgi:hypothetical protein